MVTKAQNETCLVLPLKEPIIPFELFRKVAHLPYAAFLDSAATSPQQGRYSYITAAPLGMFQVRHGQAYWNNTALEGDAFSCLQHQLSRFKQDLMSGLPPFQGGALGYLSYEAGHLIETLPQTKREDLRLLDMHLPFYDWVIAIDHLAIEADENGETPKGWIISTGLGADGKQDRQAAQKRLSWITELLAQEAPALTASPKITGWRSNFSRPAFERAIEATRTYILDGDIFQANITQQFSAQLPSGSDQKTSPLAFYATLREVNAAPFAAYLDIGDHVITSSSPERFVTLSPDKSFETRPIKGTAPRDLANPDQDQAYAKALEESEKDRAENIMITDLLRNDLSKVCKPGSIKVPQLCGLESFARVHHLVSTVTGEMKDSYGAVALLGATFPGGSITGAPKIRAMEIITELEQLPRNAYCGSIGYIAFNGAMDTNIAIRTVTFKDDKVWFNVGGGITALSNPAEEYEECLHKANAIFRAFGTSLEAQRRNLEAGSARISNKTIEKKGSRS
ncbi:MAG: aminodeoxychorismate synthase component I [Cohaesibacter sp.]|jgi:para-aminobenzoate synthetase component 1|nr:aminodeoxychorismate synthase component I [Cohaesibacter sp.]